MAKARTASKFNAPKTFRLSPAILIGTSGGGDWRDASSRGKIITNSFLSYFVAIKPVLGSQLSSVYSQPVATVLSLIAKYLLPATAQESWSTAIYRCQGTAPQVVVGISEFYVIIFTQCAGDGN